MGLYTGAYMGRGGGDGLLALKKVKRSDDGIQYLLRMGRLQEEIFFVYIITTFIVYIASVAFVVIIHYFL